MDRASRDLIMDLGVGHGEDTQFYLDKGFRVVGVEADPVLVAELRTRFAEPLVSRRFILEPVGVWDRPGPRLFHRNRECDLRSSFEPPFQGIPANFETVEVDCVTLARLFDRHGCPYYLKIDLATADTAIIGTLAALPVRPTFLSLEEFDIERVNALFALGYNMFSVRPRRDEAAGSLCVRRPFARPDAGPFGHDRLGWMSLVSARRMYRQMVRRRGKAGIGRSLGHDLHATHWPRAIDDRSLDLFDDRELD